MLDQAVFKLLQVNYEMTPTSSCVEPKVALFYEVLESLRGEDCLEELGHWTCTLKIIPVP